MTDQHDVIVVGAGHNGLTCAAYLARAGLNVVVVERRGVPGGVAASEEILPGCTIDTGAHWIAGIPDSVRRDLSLERHGVDIRPADPSVFAPSADGDHLTLHTDMARCVEAIRRHSKQDANRLSGFLKLTNAAMSFIRASYDHPAIRVPRPRLQDAGLLLELARSFRRLDKAAKAEIVRMLSMSIADLTGEWFESDVLRGTIAASGIAGLFQGPMAGGTVYTFLHAHAGAAPGTIRPTCFVRGGVGQLSLSLAEAARTSGAQIRMRSGVRSIMVINGKAVGVLMDDGTECRARSVVSNADPHATALTLIGPSDLEPNVVRKVRNIRCRGATAKVHLVVDELPRFTTVSGSPDVLHGVTSIAPSVEYLERGYDDAKYGGISQRPYLEMTVPTLTDSGTAPDGRHVLSIVVQYAPHTLSTGSWDAGASNRLADLVVNTLAEYAPNVPDALQHRHVITPRDLEVTYGLPEGNINHGDLTLDQAQFMRPIPEWSQYVTSIRNVYLCGAGTHGGGGVNCVPGRNAARQVIRDFKRNVHA